METLIDPFTHRQGRPRRPRRYPFIEWVFGKLIHDSPPEELPDLLPAVDQSPWCPGKRRGYRRSIEARGARPIAEMREVLC